MLAPAIESVLCLTALWAAGRILRSGVIDDTYIFLRFARNLAAGHGFRFNPGGPAVEGFTSILWVLLLSLWGKLGGSLVSGARWLSLVCAALGIVGLSDSVLQGPGGPARLQRLLVKLLLLLSPAMFFWAGTGMDVAIFVLATVVIGRCLVDPSCPARVLGLVVGAAAWVRLEAFFVWLPWVVISLLILPEPTGTVLGGPSLSAPDSGRPARSHRRERILETVLWAVVLILPNFILRLAVFHAWLPNTFYAKVALPLPQRLAQGATYFRESLPVVGPWAVLFVLAGALAWKQRNRPAAVLLLGAFFWTLSVFASGGDHFALGRFWLPLLPLIAMAVGAFDWQWPIAGQRWIVPAVVTAALAFSFAGVWSDGGRAARREAALTRAWAKVGLWLGETQPSGTKLATMVAGAIPYYSGLDAFDLLGLVTPEVAREGQVYAQGRPGHQRYDTDALLRYRPDLIILQSSGIWPEPRAARPDLIDPRYAYALFNAYQDPRVQRLYEPASTRLPDGTWLDVLRLRSAAVQPK